MMTEDELLEKIRIGFPELKTEKERRNKLQQIEKKLIDRLSSPIKRHTIQFYRNDYPQNEYHPPRPYGSGVMLKLDGEYYIATASHVLKDHEKIIIGVYTRTDGYYQVGTVINTLPTESGGNDLADLAVWAVETDIALQIAPDDWWYDLLDAISNHQETPEYRYLVYGFPITKTDVKIRTQELRQDPFRFHTRGYSHTGEGKRAEKNEKINLLVEFHKDKVMDVATGQRQQAPYPYGMSGCGLWYYDGIRYRLVGIMNEWKQPKEHIPALMGTRIDLILQAIRWYKQNKSTGQG